MKQSPLCLGLKRILNSFLDERTTEHAHLREQREQSNFIASMEEADDFKEATVGLNGWMGTGPQLLREAPDPGTLLKM